MLIIDNTKIQQLIERYKELLQKNGGLQGCDELYKWELISKQKGHPNPEVENFKQEIENLKFSSPSGGELCYHTQITAIRSLAQFEEKEYSNSFRLLFNEGFYLQERIEAFINYSDRLWNGIEHNFSGKTTSMCDERLISCFLTFYNPDKYTFYKDSVYQSLCNYLEVPSQKPRYKLAHYYELLNPFIECIQKDTELLDLINSELDDNHCIQSIPLIVQDILWHLSISSYEKKIEVQQIETSIEKIFPVNMKELSLLKQKKQIILQGAPGTGKTYKTAELAVALCDDVDTTSMDRKDIIERYHELYDEGRIGFVTFHQSTDYEEFVEGIKPSITGNGITYKVLDGIFKKMAIIASATKHNITNEIPKYFGSEDYNSIYTSILNDIKAGKITALESAKYGTFPVYCDGDDIKCNSKAVKRHSHLKTLFNYFINKNRYDIRGLGRDDYFKLIEQLTDGRTRTLDYNYYQGVLRVMLQRAKEATMGIKKQSTETPVEIEDYNDNIIPDQPYLLIIDEINRGNISKIFGELITLLEADKRIGEENELTVTLPYSQETFGVPSNLYIIGTMNTADRSVGYIDYAIRRRFAFITLKADRNVIENYYTDNDLKQKALAYFDQADTLMKVSSEYEKDDLMIGHSYFLAKSEEELQNKMVFEVRPLLLEYFNDGLLAFRKDDEEYKAIKNFGEA